MSMPSRFENIERNPQTHAEHKKETFWQIILPLLIGLLLVLLVVIGVIFSAVQPVSEVSRYADVALIWMILPALFFALLAMIILAGFVYLVTMLLHILPRYAAIALLYLNMGKDKVHEYSNAIVEPIIKMRSSWASVRWLTKRGK
jgi:uncharacterized membrane protein